MKSMMSTLVLTLVGIAAIINTGSAQNFYLRGGLGYAGALGGQTMDGSSTALNGTVTNTTVDSVGYTSYKLKKSSFGSGLHLSLALGYMINEQVGIDAGFNFGMSPKSYTAQYNNISLNSVPSNLSIVQKASNVVLFIPSLVLQTKGDKIKLYSRTGVVLPLNTKITQDQISQNLPNTGAVTVEDDTWEITSKFNLGFAAAVGLKYSLNEHMQLTGEVNILSLSVLTKQSDVTNVTVDGQSYSLAAVPDSLKHVIYSTNFTSTTNNYYKQPAFAQTFSNFGVHIGFIYTLGDASSTGGGKKKKGKYRSGDGYYHH